MKAIYTLKGWSITLFIFMILLIPVMAQARYKHLPRVKIEKQIQEKQVVAEKSNTSIPVVTEEKIVEEPETPATIIAEESTVMTDIFTSTLNKHDKADVIKVKVKEQPQKKNWKAFSESLKVKNYLSKVKVVKDVKKTNIIGYLLWFLIVLLLAIAIFVLAFVFLGIIAYTLHYVFLVFGIAGLVIALLILIFGLAGVIA